MNAREVPLEETQVEQKHESSVRKNQLENEESTPEQDKYARDTQNEPWNHNPTINEIAVSASASYVRVLLDSIKNQETFINEMTRKIDNLTLERESYRQEEGKQIEDQAEQLRTLRIQVHELNTRLQREDEKGKRLLHENTVLYTQLLEQREQIANLQRVAHERALRLREKGLNINNTKNAITPASQNESSCNGNSSSSNKKMVRKSFSIRSAVQQYTQPMDNAQLQRELYYHSYNNNDYYNYCYPQFGRVSMEEPQVHHLSPSFVNKVRAHVVPGVQDSLQFFHNSNSHDKESGSKRKSNNTTNNANQFVKVGKEEAINEQHNMESKSNERDDDNDDVYDDDDTKDREVMQACVPSASSRGARILALTEEVQALCECLDAQRMYYEKMRGELIAQADENERDNLVEMRQLREHSDTLSKEHESVLKELITLRQTRDRELELMHGREDWLRRSLQEAISTAEALRTRNHVDVKTVEEQIKSKYYPRLARLQHELMHRRNITAQEMNKYELALQNSNVQRSELTRKLREEKERRSRDEERHRLAMEGIRSELDGMRQTMRLLEKKVYFAQFRESHAPVEFLAHVANSYNPSNHEDPFNVNDVYDGSDAIIPCVEHIPINCSNSKNDNISNNKNKKRKTSSKVSGVVPHPTIQSDNTKNSSISEQNKSKEYVKVDDSKQNPIHAVDKTNQEESVKEILKHKTLIS